MVVLIQQIQKELSVGKNIFFCDCVVKHLPKIWLSVLIGNSRTLMRKERPFEHKSYFRLLNDVRLIVQHFYSLFNWYSFYSIITVLYLMYLFFLRSAHRNVLCLFLIFLIIKFFAWTFLPFSQSLTHTIKIGLFI